MSVSPGCRVLYSSVTAALALQGQDMLAQRLCEIHLTWKLRSLRIDLPRLCVLVSWGHHRTSLYLLFCLSLSCFIFLSVKP